MYDYRIDSGTLSIFINSLLVLAVGAFVFASITVWYMFGEKFHGWEERRRRRRREKKRYCLRFICTSDMTQNILYVK